MTRPSQAPTVTPDDAIRPSDEEGGPWVVILYNCDCHTFDKVIVQLQRATGCSAQKALDIALEAHTRGRAIAYTGARDAVERAAAILRSIRLQVETDRF